MSAYQHRWENSETIDLNCSKIVCVGKNYADHIKEMNSATPMQAVLFIKPPSSLCDANQAIKISHNKHLGAMHHELEISLLIGSRLNSENHSNAIASVIGVGLGIDLTLRDIQSELKNQGHPWERSKSFDGSCALSPFVNVTSSNTINFNDIELELILNNQSQQHSNSSMMLNLISELLSNIAQVFTLEPGDVVLTGTPAGVGPLQVGDRLTGLLNKQKLILDTEII